MSETTFLTRFYAFKLTYAKFNILMAVILDCHLWPLWAKFNRGSGRFKIDIQKLHFIPIFMLLSFIITIRSRP